jgi:6,7-dimethyl-8-ribityllumazine synthase
MSDDPFNYERFDVAGLRIGIVAASYNEDLTGQLLGSTEATLLAEGLPGRCIKAVRVPGAFEVPVVASVLAKSGEFNAVIGLGVVIAGGTSHHELIGQTTAKALLDISVATGVPIVNGILTVNTLEQAKERITGKQARGPEFARTALHMGSLQKGW